MSQSSVLPAGNYLPELYLQTCNNQQNHTQLYRTAHSAQNAHAAQSNTPAQNCPAIKVTLHLQPFALDPPIKLSTHPDGQVLFPICSAQPQ